MSRSKDILIAFILFAGTIGLYSRSFTFEFLNYDDDEYVYDNPHIKSGLSLGNLSWAFTAVHSANWHPVTWISHMIDAQIWGVSRPGGHHATNVILHAVNAILLYLLARRFTDLWYLAAGFAALFAWHPLRVESVAWVAERKDVLAGLFWLAGTIAYIAYARKQTAGRYTLVLMFLALGLMSKPMLVTFPFALLLLDVWPLKRITFDRLISNRQPLVEKVPMVALVIASSIATFFAQRSSGAVAMTETIPMTLRLENGAVAVVTYLRQFVAPVNLSFFYPHPVFLNDGVIHAWKWVSCLAVIALLSSLAIALIRRWPAVFVGWFFFVGTLIPVIGIVQVGAQAHADRYTYIPMLGIALILICAAAALINRFEQLAPMVGAVLGIAILSCAIATRQQVGFWKDSRTLMSRALMLDDRNFIAHNNLGIVLDEAGFKDAAAEHFAKAVTLCPRFPHAEFNLANVLEFKGDTKEALRHYNRAVKLDPAYAGAYNNYGNLLTKLGRDDDAIMVYRQGVKQCPTDWRLKHHLATSLASKGDITTAVELWREAVKLNPDSAEMHRLLGMSFAMMGRLHDAVLHLHRAVSLQPDNTEALNALAWIWATAPTEQIRNPEMATKLATRACELTHSTNPTFLDTLAAGYAAEGKFDRAQRIIEQAIEIAQKDNEEKFLQQLRTRQSLYAANRPYVAGK
jgi:tetratricopeptide (TPR) repeat protein